MAEQTSYVRIRGSLGGLTFYKKRGLDLIRIRTGATKEQIEKDPAFKRTRENMSEFAGAAVVGKALRVSFQKVVKLMSDDTAVGRITGMFKRVNSVGLGIRGQRPINILPNKQYLEGFQFNKYLPLSSVFYPDYELPTLNANRDVITWTVPDFNTDDSLTIPEGATHFKLVLAAGVLSDYKYIEETKLYEPTNPDVNGTRGVEYSAAIPVTGMVGSDTTLIVNLGIGSLLPAEVGVPVGIGIVFYQMVDSLLYELASDNAMVLVVVG